MLGSDRTGRAEECLWLCHRCRIESAAQRAASSAFHGVVSACHARDRIENDDDILAKLDESASTLEDHFSHVGVARGRHVEARCDDFAVSPRDHLAHFLGALIDEQHEKRCFGMIYGNTFDDRLEKHRLSSSCRSYDQRALSISDRGNQIDRSSCELGTAFGGPSCLQLELSLGV